MFEFSDPALVDLVQRNRVEVVQFFPALPNDGDQVGLFELLQVLCYGLACHVHLLAERAQCLTIIALQQVKQMPATGVGQCFKYFVDVQ